MFNLLSLGFFRAFKASRAKKTPYLKSIPLALKTLGTFTCKCLKNAKFMHSTPQFFFFFSGIVFPILVDNLANGFEIILFAHV